MAWQARHSACLLLHDHTSPPSLIGMIWSDTTASTANPFSKHIAHNGLSFLCALLSLRHWLLLYSLLSSLNLERWKALVTTDQGCFFCFLLMVGIRMERLMMGLFLFAAFFCLPLSYPSLRCSSCLCFALEKFFLLLAVLLWSFHYLLP